jgi:hypothetical protein
VSVILDLIGSVVLAGFVALMALRMNMNIANSNNSYKADVMVQESLVSLVQSIEYDFRKMGFGVIDPTTVIRQADTTCISFLSDVDNDGQVDTLTWYLGHSISSTPNPNDKMLYRRLGSPTEGVSLIGSLPGVTQFGLRYLDQYGAVAEYPGQIWIVETTLRVESPYKVQDREVLDQSYGLWGYSAAFWRQTRLASRNLRRHG